MKKDNLIAILLAAGAGAARKIIEIMMNSRKNS